MLLDAQALLSLVVPTVHLTNPPSKPLVDEKHVRIHLAATATTLMRISTMCRNLVECRAMTKDSFDDGQRGQH
eukprot:1140110-Pelagomonas_calceolata.AAC.2